MKTSIFAALAMLINLTSTAHAAAPASERVTCTVQVNGKDHSTVWNPMYGAYEYKTNNYEASVVLQDINGTIYGSTIVNEVDGDLFAQSGFLPIPSPATGSNWMGAVFVSKKLNYTFYCEPKVILRPNK